MLKIKDNVNLLTLAKYGFSYNFVDDSVYICNESCQLGILRVFLADRFIHFHAFDKGYNVLFRLIKDDLVEMV